MSLREEIEREYVIERDGWAAERVNRVTARFDPSFETCVVWSESGPFAHGAFTCPGNTIYICRRLLERLPDDDAAAFVIAHEIAHHRLGHLPTKGHELLLHVSARLVMLALSSWVTTTKREDDADRLAIEMCIDAGYDVERCLESLQQLMLVSLDYGDVIGVFGGEVKHEHTPLLHRIAKVRAHAAGVARGHRLAVELAERAKTRKRRWAIAAGAVAVSAALLVVRRSR